jgi:hypothetical protein
MSIYYSRKYTLLKQSYSINFSNHFSCYLHQPMQIHRQQLLPVLGQGLHKHMVNHLRWYFINRKLEIFSSNSISGNLYYYQALEIMVYTSGTYSFKSDSSIHICGYFYNYPFNPNSPNVN